MENMSPQVVKLMIKKRNYCRSQSLMLGITFKENCPDVRNTKIVDVIAALADYGITVSIYDPYDPKEVKHEYALETTTVLPIINLIMVVLERHIKSFYN
jgi:UDP-N-acetyl-D-galactosamine dehydrogenase